MEPAAEAGVQFAREPKIPSLAYRLARVAVEPQNRERCYARTGEILRHNLPIVREWIAGFGGRLTWREPGDIRR